LWIDVACAREMENLSTTFFFTMIWLPLCGITFVLVLVCSGLCLEELLTSLLVGVSLEGLECYDLEDGANLHLLFIYFFCVWKERNLRCFEDLESSMEDILASFFHTLYFWIVAFLSPLLISFADFLVRFSIPS
jgi:hypothetical protein